jgi:hypothetical protein
LVAFTAQATPETVAVSYYGAAYGNSAYVICGQSGKIDSSADGVTWTARTANAGTNTLNDVLYASGLTLFVCVGLTHVITTSAAGDTWAAQTSNVTGNIFAVAYKTTTDLLVAVTGSGEITISADGGTWAAQASGTTAALGGIAWNGTVWCAVGTGVTVTGDAAGTTWTVHTRPQSFSWVTSDGTYFYATQASSATCWISSDGITWVPYTTPAILLRIRWINSQLIGVTNAGTVYTSTDGMSWSTPAGIHGSALGAGTYTGRSYWLNSEFILTFSGGLYTSADGQEYHAHIGMTLNGVACSSGGALVAVGNNGLVLTSSDGGATWAQQQAFCGSDQTHWLDVAYSPSIDLFCAIGGGCTIYTSNDDGATWTHQPFTSALLGTTPAPSFLSVAWSPSLDLFVAVGAAGMIATSPDGAVWTVRTSGTALTLYQVCWNASLATFCAVGANGVVLLSTNGTTWALYPQGVPGDFSACASLEALGFVGWQGNNTWSSSGGTVWTLRMTTPGIGGTAGGKAFSGTVDAMACIPYTPYLVCTQDGRTQQVFGLDVIATLPAMLAGCYDSTHDRYIVVGASAYVCVLSRTYDKSTHFGLPALQNQWIKAL